MIRPELAERIADCLVDPYTYCAEDIMTEEIADVKTATEWLKDIRSDEDAAELEPDERLPEEVTPEMIMEVWNCIVRKALHEVRIDRLAEWITKNENIALHNSYFREYPNNDPEILPTDWLGDLDSFPFPTANGFQPSILDLICIGQHSSEFNFNHEYCWFDVEKDAMFSSNTPFADGVADAKALATYAIDEKGECLEEILNEMDDADVFKTFGCNREEMLK